METWNNYPIRGYNFTLWFFRIILLITATVLIVVFGFKINDTVSIREGEIVATSPQSDFKAPFEAQILKINVREGQPVRAGDTLLVMRNLDFLEQQAKTATEIEFLQKKIQSIKVLQQAVEQKKLALDQTSAIRAHKYQLDINRLVQEMKNLDQQFRFQRQRLSSAQEKFVGDSILYKKDMLSRYEYNNTKDASLALKQNMANLRNERSKQATEKNLAYNNFTSEQNTILLSKLQLEENAQELVQARIDNENQLLQARETLHKVDTELKKQYVIATSAGLVNFLFNTKQASNLIPKGDLLVSVAPQTAAYYAKVIVPEKDMPYLKKGLAARLKLDAYHKLEHGPMSGKVLYISERRENEKYYALVDLPKNLRYQLKSGYRVQGQIVLRRLPIYRFLIKKLFKQIEPA
ncbi:MAG: HlyD family secretion protein [Adhaeribacter sp.]